ncbi:MAG: hypothetical protein ABSA23_15300 [Anaerolineales bacterium]|jgi:hypothetical protein
MLIEKEAVGRVAQHIETRAGSLPNKPLLKSHSCFAEERQASLSIRTARERPLERRPMLVGHKVRFLPLCFFEVKNELRWYRGARRPQQDAGIFIFREESP